MRGRGTDGPSNPSPLVFVRSVVDSVPGVTRDPRHASAALSDLLMRVVDTAGLETAVGEAAGGNQSIVPKDASLLRATAMCPDPLYRDLYKKMEAGTVGAVDTADVVFFVVDAASGVTPIDHAIGKWLRSAVNNTTKHVVLVVNKCDLANAESRAMEAYSLGFGEPVVVSAEHGLGFADLYSRINSLRLLRGATAEPPVDAGPQFVEDPPTKPLTEEEEIRASFDDELVIGYGEKTGEEPLRQLVLSIVGRPNVGKSTLLNRLVGKERSLVGPAAGVTRDAVLSEWKVPEHIQKEGSIPIWLVDTAGVRAITKVAAEPLENLSVKSSLRALRHSHVVLVVLDAEDPLCLQDTKLLDVTVTEGRAVVIVVNKMDKLRVDDLEEWRLKLRYSLNTKVEQLSGVETVEMSAKNWHENPNQVKRLYHAVQRARSRWEKRIPTSALNRFVTRFNERMSVGSGVQGERRNRIGVTKFITQKKIRPPMFRLDGSSAVSMNYLRSLTNAIRNEFGFQGVPIRVKRPSRRKRR